MFPLLGATAVSALLATTAITSPFVLSAWAKSDFLVTTIDEGTGIMIDRGDSFERLEISMDGYHVNNPRKPWFVDHEPLWEILPDEPGVSYDTRSWPLRASGTYWVGLPLLSKIHSYQFSWNEYEDDSTGDLKVNHRNEDTQVFITSDFAYVMALDEVRTKDNLPVRVEFVLIVRMTNPKLALVDSNNWIIQLRAYVERLARNFVGSFTYNQLRSETDEAVDLKKENFSLPVRNLTLELPDEDDPAAPKGTKGEIGITIKSANLNKIVLTGQAAAEYERLSILEYETEQEAKATVSTSVAAATAYVNDARAKATGIEAIGTATATASTAQINALKNDPAMAALLLMNDAVKSPGAGKVVLLDLASLKAHAGNFLIPHPQA